MQPSLRLLILDPGRSPRAKVSTRRLKTLGQLVWRWVPPCLNQLSERIWHVWLHVRRTTSPKSHAFQRWVYVGCLKISKWYEIRFIWWVIHLPIHPWLCDSNMIWTSYVLIILDIIVDLFVKKDVIRQMLETWTWEIIFKIRCDTMTST